MFSFLRVSDIHRSWEGNGRKGVCGKSTIGTTQNIIKKLRISIQIELIKEIYDVSKPMSDNNISARSLCVVFLISPLSWRVCWRRSPHGFWFTLSLSRLSLAQTRFDHWNHLEYTFCIFAQMDSPVESDCVCIVYDLMRAKKVLSKQNWWNLSE